MFCEMKAALRDLRRCVQHGEATHHRQGQLVFGQNRYSITSTVPSDRRPASREYSLGEIWLFVLLNLLGDASPSPAETRELEALVKSYSLKPITDTRVQSTIESPDSLILFFRSQHRDHPEEACASVGRKPPGEAHSFPSSSTANKTCLIEEEVDLEASLPEPLLNRATRQQLEAGAGLPDQLVEMQSRATAGHLEALQRIRQLEQPASPQPSPQLKAGSMRAQVDLLDAERIERQPRLSRGPGRSLRTACELALLVPSYSREGLLNASNCAEFIESGVLNLADFSARGEVCSRVRIRGSSGPVWFRVFCSARRLAVEGWR